MAVEFPDPLVVPDGVEIEVGNAAEIACAARLLMLVIAARVDFGAGLDRLAEEGETVIGNIRGDGEQLRRIWRIAHEFGAGRGIGKNVGGYERLLEPKAGRCYKTPGIHELLPQPECDFTRTTHEI